MMKTYANESIADLSSHVRVCRVRDQVLGVADGIRVAQLTDVFPLLKRPYVVRHTECLKETLDLTIGVSVDVDRANDMRSEALSLPSWEVVNCSTNAYEERDKELRIGFKVHYYLVLLK